MGKSKWAPLTVTLLVFVALGGFLVKPQSAAAAQICGCKKSNGKVRRLASGVPLTCPLSQTIICWNENTPPGAFSVRVFNSVAPPPIADSTATVLTWDSERWDTANLHDTSTNTSRLTAPVDGTYLIFAEIGWDDINLGFRVVSLRLNGVSGTFIAAQNLIPNSSNFVVSNNQSVSTVFQLAAGDYVECVVYQTSGSSQLVSQVGTAALTDFGMAKLE